MMSISHSNQFFNDFQSAINAAIKDGFLVSPAQIRLTDSLANCGTVSAISSPWYGKPPVELRVAELESELSYTQLRLSVAVQDNNILRDALVLANKALAEAYEQIAQLSKAASLPSTPSVREFPAAALKSRPVRIGLIETVR